MHYLRASETAQLWAGSSDANFSLDHSANVAPLCNNYHDLMGAIQGLTTFANAEWYDVMTRPLYMLREFVVANKRADPNHTPRRVQRTLDEVNQFLGSAFIHLASDSPAWWREFTAATRRIKFSSAAWALALQSTALPLAPQKRLRPGPRPGPPTYLRPQQHSGRS